jgi:hypothetical protein
MARDCDGARPARQLINGPPDELAASTIDERLPELGDG